MFVRLYFACPANPGELYDNGALLKDNERSSKSLESLLCSQADIKHFNFLNDIVTIMPMYSNNTSACSGIMHV